MKEHLVKQANFVRSVVAEHHGSLDIRLTGRELEILDTWNKPFERKIKEALYINMESSKVLMNRDV